jgi:hypothetical protein
MIVVTENGTPASSILVHPVYLRSWIRRETPRLGCTTPQLMDGLETSFVCFKFLVSRRGNNFPKGMNLPEAGQPEASHDGFHAEGPWYCSARRYKKANPSTCTRWVGLPADC